MDLDTVTRSFERYRTKIHEHGHDADGLDQVFLVRTYVAPTDAEARADTKHVVWYYHLLGSHRAPSRTMSLRAKRPSSERPGFMRRILRETPPSGRRESLLPSAELDYASGFAAQRPLSLQAALGAGLNSAAHAPGTARSNV